MGSSRLRKAMYFPAVVAVQWNPPVKARQSIVEHPFGTLKHWWGHSHFLMRGLKKVRGEFSLSALAYNLRRVLNILGVRALLKALQSRPHSDPHSSKEETTSLFGSFWCLLLGLSYSLWKRVAEVTVQFRFFTQSVAAPDRNSPLRPLAAPGELRRCADTRGVQEA